MTWSTIGADQAPIFCSSPDWSIEANWLTTTALGLGWLAVVFFPRILPGTRAGF